MERPGIALQMFTLREEARLDYVGTVRQVAEAGYDSIETAFGTGGLSASTARRVLDELGLRVVSSHVGSDRLGTALVEEVAFNLAIGNENLVCAELPPQDRSDEPAFHRWAEELQRIGTQCRGLGAHLSYHSHAFEFRRFGATTGLEILLSETDPDVLSWEPDVYWITYAGEEPAEWITRYADRCRLIHLKDLKPEPLPDDPIAANARDLRALLSTSLGDGTIDFAPAVVAATSAEWLIVEQDFSDIPMFESIIRSRLYLRECGL